MATGTSTSTATSTPPSWPSSATTPAPPTPPPPRPPSPLPHPLRHSPLWQDPITGAWVPKRIDKNLQWRRSELLRADADEGYRAFLTECCSASILFWLNFAGWTYRQKEVSSTGRESTVTVSDAPFVTWPVQDELVALIDHKIATGGRDGLGGDLVIDKSRDMGASWICLAVFHHWWQFRAGCDFLELSRIEDLVDKRDDHKSLFWKHDYLIKMQPTWLLPGIDRRPMHLGNTTLGSTIDGQSTTPHSSRGDRRKAVLLDEFAAVQHGEAMLRASADVSPVRIFNSTPEGAGTAYTRLRFCGTIDVFVLPWWRHPEKGLNARQVEENGKVVWTSPWREFEKGRRDARDVAQNIDIDHTSAGRMVFDAQVLGATRAEVCRAPELLGELGAADGETGWRPLEEADVKAGKLWPTARLRFRRCEKGAGSTPWRLWFEPDPDTGRYPDQDDYPIIAADVSRGMGASNSTITVRSSKTGRKLAAYANAGIAPHEFAVVLAAAGWWFGGCHGYGFLIWEANGPGQVIGRRIVNFNYPWYYTQRDEDTQGRDGSDLLGWNSNRHRKQYAVELYRRDLALRHFLNYDVDAIAEAEAWIYFEDGSIGPGSLIEEPGGARENHGDRVIADMLSTIGVMEAPRVRPKIVEASPFSLTGRKAVQRREKRREDRKW